MNVMDSDTEIVEFVCDSSPELGQPALFATAGPDSGRLFVLHPGRHAVGRAVECTFVIADTLVSRRHTDIDFETDGSVHVHDCDSANGTYLNGLRIRAARLHEGDRIRLGPLTALKFTRVDGAERQCLETLHTNAVQDPLTGATCRMRFLERLRDEFAWAGRNSTALSVLFLDLDRFKAVNDNFGHAAGDLVLARTADVLRRVLRAGDVLGRLGGDEFGIILRGADQGASRAAVERFRMAVARTRISVPSTDRVRVPVSVSIGSATQTVGEYPDAEAMLAAADCSMYSAKSAGRPKADVSANSG